MSCSIHWIPKIIREFQHEHPDIHFKIVEGVEGELADWIQERRVDIGFISHQKGHNYQFLPVMDDELFAVIPKNHPFAECDAVPIEAFEGQPFIITEYTPGSDVHRILKQAKVKPDIRYITINEFSIISMVEHELGLSILPGLLLRGQVGDFITRRSNQRYHASSDSHTPPKKNSLRHRRSFLNMRRTFYWMMSKYLSSNAFAQTCALSLSS